MLRIDTAWVLVTCGLAVTACRSEVMLGGEQADDGGTGGSATSATVDAGTGGTGGGTGGSGSGSSSGGGGPTATPVVMAKVQSPAAIAVDGTNLYWVSYEIGPVGEIPLAGGSAVTLDGISASTIATDANRVYTVSPSGGNAPQGLVVACAKVGCGGNPTTLASGQNGVWGVAVDATSVYWTIQGMGGGLTPGVMKAPLAGGNATALVTGMSANALAVAAGIVYFTASPPGGSVNLWKVPVTGGTPTVVVPGGVSTVSVDGTNAYFATSNGTIGQIPLAGGAPTVLATNQKTQPLQLAIDGQRVYWAETGTGRIQSVPIGGGPVVALATGQAAPIGIAVDASHVYWSNLGDGTIMKLAK